MPIYEYQCPKCGRFELMQKVSEPALKRCPTCKTKVSKLISNTSFQLKGTGWYVTDYARKDTGGAKSSASDGGEGKAKEAKAETKESSKPADSKSKEATAAS
ncbi:MAG TPA: zinc ribbon domain-containing protein [Candidatus Kryptonia bacterium]|nr:zinc ribbon domain-containing protein [Candidatus Kryptonia bacterium]